MDNTKEFRIGEKPEIVMLVKNVVDKKPEAQQEFYERYEKLVKRIVFNFFGKQNLIGTNDTIVTIEDCEQEVWCYLFSNLYKYNPERSMVSTYIYLMSNACLLRYKENNGKQMRLPVYKTQLFNRIKKFIANYELTNGYFPKEEVIVSEFDLTQKDLLQFYEYISSSVSLEQNVSSSERETPLSEILISNENIESNIASKIAVSEMKDLMLNSPALKKEQKKIASMWLFEDINDKEICEVMQIEKQQLSYEKRKIKNILKKLFVYYI